MFDKSTHFRWITTSTRMLFVVVILGGCSHRGGPRRPDINELIQDAIEHSARQPQGVIASESTCETCQISQADRSDDIFLASDEQTVESLPSPLEVVPALSPENPFTGASKPTVLLNEEFLETDVREALLLLAEEAGTEVLLDEQVRGVVNVSLKDTTFEKALEKILLPLGYVFAQREGQYLVAPADPKSPLFQHIAVQYEYQPRNLSPKALMDTTPRAMKDFVLEVEGANRLLIYAPEQYAQMLLDRYSKLDQPVPQVVLEAMICVVSPDCGFRFGVNWGHAVELDGKTALNMGVSGLAIDTKFSPAGFDAMFRDFATTSFFIRKLAEHGYLTIRAAPRVMARDNEQANISINRETFFTVQPLPGTSGGDNNSFFFQQDVQKVEAGISLDITPRIRGDVVTVDIEKAEVSEDIRNANIDASVNPFPIINRRSVSTTVDVKDGRTLVIGGLVQRETVDRVNKVPGLGDVPVVGRLFKNSQTQTREVEVVIFISPKIVDPCQDCNVSISSNNSTSMK